jgi:prepilin-type N-terminal cleavage/methylation domain-containing protein
MNRTRRIQLNRFGADAFSLVELLVVVAIIGVLAALVMPAISRSRLRAQNIMCVSQLRQLGAATRLYADENNSRLPTAELLPTSPIDPANPKPRICDVLTPQLGAGSAGTNHATVFRCPSDDLGRFAAEGSSYEWNIDLNGHRMDETSSSEFKFAIFQYGPNGMQGTNGTVQLLFSPEATPLLADYDDFHPRSLPSGKNVVFMDDHVTALEAPEAPELPVP